jgi:Helicase HerA, central domain
MARSRKSQIVRTREIGADWTLASIGSLGELIPVPVWVAVPWKLCVWSIRHWYLSGPFGLFIWLWTRLHSAILAGVFTVLTLSFAISLTVLVGLAAVPGGQIIPLVVNFFRRRRVRARWLDVCEDVGLTSRRGNRPCPRGTVTITATGVRVIAYPGRIGKTYADVLKMADALAASFGARDVRVSKGRTQTRLDRFHKRQGHSSPAIAVVDIDWSDVFSKTLSLTDLPGSPVGRCVIGLGEDNEPVTIGLDTSLLIGGVTGSGKSNLVWTILAKLLIDGIHFRVSVIDPAGGVELSALDPAYGGIAHVTPEHDEEYEDGKGNVKTRHIKEFVHYIEGSENAELLIKKMKDRMRARLASMKAKGVRKHVATEEEPMEVLLIDEFLLLASVKKAGDSDLGQLIAVGRKAGFIVICITQVAQVDVMERLRDLFRQRICLQMKNRESVEAVLGDDALNDGAMANKIGENPGVGYVYVNEQQGYRKFKAPYVTDEEVKMIGAGIVPDYLVEKQNLSEVLDGDEITALYRWYGLEWNKDRTVVINHDRLLYGGITNDLMRRTSQHEDGKPHWEDIRRNTVEWFGTRQEAIDKENEMIDVEDPLWNIAGKGKVDA